MTWNRIRDILSILSPCARCRRNVTILIHISMTIIETSECLPKKGLSRSRLTIRTDTTYDTLQLQLISRGAIHQTTEGLVLSHLISYAFLITNLRPRTTFLALPRVSACIIIPIKGKNCLLTFTHCFTLTRTGNRVNCTLDLNTGYTKRITFHRTIARNSQGQRHIPCRRFA